MEYLTLRQWRLARELTIDEMAAACGVHPNTYRAWEEHPEKVSVGKAVMIAEALGASVDAIFFSHSATKCS